MTNDTPPQACLADFGFTTLVPNPQDNLPPSPVLEGGTPMFMAPELLAPSEFGLETSIPTQEGDIYAFGLVTLQVMASYCGHLVFLNDLSGPYGRATISCNQASGTRISCPTWCTSG